MSRCNGPQDRQIILGSLPVQGIYFLYFLDCFNRPNFVNCHFVIPSITMVSLPPSDLLESPDEMDSIPEANEDGQLTIRIPNSKVYMARQSQ
ncbi:hypothetical protein V8B97DRAFT_1683321 [Scleroderma yunnanense]